MCKSLCLAAAFWNMAMCMATRFLCMAALCSFSAAFTGGGSLSSLPILRGRTVCGSSGSFRLQANKEVSSTGAPASAQYACKHCVSGPCVHGTCPHLQFRFEQRPPRPRKRRHWQVMDIASSSIQRRPQPRRPLPRLLLWRQPRLTVRPSPLPLRLPPLCLPPLHPPPLRPPPRQVLLQFCSVCLRARPVLLTTSIMCAFRLSSLSICFEQRLTRLRRRRHLQVMDTESSSIAKQPPKNPQPKRLLLRLLPWR